MLQNYMVEIITKLPWVQQGYMYTASKFIHPPKICMTQSKLMIQDSYYYKLLPELFKSKHQISVVEVLIVNNGQC